jgi:light-regulated signal transduction histidine kinase (bacteriophytochrome)
MSNSNALANDAEDELIATSSLLDLLSPTLNHDLPNMMVALQGFVQMFADEAKSLLKEPEAESYQRIQAISKKLAFTITTVKLINKVRTQSISEDSIFLVEFLKEVAATVRHRLPGIQIRFVSMLKVTEFTATHHLLHQTLVEAVQLLARFAAGESLRCYVSSSRLADDIVLTLGAFRQAAGNHLSQADKPQLSPISSFSSAVKVDYNLFGHENRLVVVLIDEMVRRWGGKLTTLRAPNEGKGISLTVPVG